MTPRASGSGARTRAGRAKGARSDDPQAEGAMSMLGALTRGPAAYAARTGWPAWAALPAALGIFGLSLIIGVLVAMAWSALRAPDTGGAFQTPEQMQHATMSIVAWLATLQVAVIALTLAAAGLFGSDRRQALALVEPAGGWRVLGPALALLFLGTAVWTGALLLWKPSVVTQDLRPFKEMMENEALWLSAFAISIGAPLSEELLFRGFLFSALAKTRLGLMGTSLLTAALWTSLHAGYSLFGLLEVFCIGLYLSWVLVRTGSLWVTILCHGVYNTAVLIGLFLVELPAPQPALLN
jgi:membrane protease YdiL (CAAX protease family)